MTAKQAISAKQPWAYLLCAGIKDVENRTWKLPEKYIGERILIHASADRKLNLMELTREQYSDFLDKVNISTLKPCDHWLRSAIIGSVRLVGCVINHPSIWAEKTPYLINPSEHPLKPTYNWVVADPILFDKPILNVKVLGFPSTLFRMSRMS